MAISNVFGDEIVYYTELLRTMKKDELVFYKNNLSEENYNTNAIEGSRVTFEETKKILSNNELIKYHQEEKFEILDYADAQSLMMCYYQEESPLSITLITDLHFELMKDSKPSFAGHIRVFGEEVTAGGKDVGYTEGEKVFDALTGLLDWYEKSSNDLRDVNKIFKVILEFKYRILRIHPFNDGNGRISRLLMNYLFLLNRMLPFIIKFEDRDKYLSTIKEAQREDDVEHYIDVLKPLYLRGLREYVRKRNFL